LRRRSQPDCSTLGAAPSETVRSECNLVIRQAGVGLSAFTHCFPLPRPAHTDIAIRSVIWRFVVLEGWGYPYTSILPARGASLLPMPFGRPLVFPNSHE